MNTDELMRLASRAAGYPVEEGFDALRLAVDLRISIDIDGDECRTVAFHDDLEDEVIEGHGFDPLGSTRLAILRCAAILGAEKGELH